MFRAKGKDIGTRRAKDSAKTLLPLVRTLGETGLRLSDALSLLMEDDKRVSVKAKDGRIRSVAIPEDLAKAFKGARWPFSGLKARAVQAAVRRLTLKLVGGGKIRYPYSPHDYRHRFAANLYRQTRDVFAVQKALGRASLAVTQVYLAGLGALE